MKAERHEPRNRYGHAAYFGTWAGRYAIGNRHIGFVRTHLLAIRHDKPSDWLPKLQERMGLGALPEVLVLLLSIVWTALFLSLVFGIFWVVYGIFDRASAVTAEEGRELRWYLLTLTAITASLGAVISLPFTLIRVGLNRRQTETAEQGLITDRINTAVEGLGAEKQTSVHRKDSRGNLLFHEKEGSESKAEDKLDYKRPVIVQLTEPNLEVRVGAIYALERISRDSELDHIQIMEILCAYIKQNAGHGEKALPEDFSNPRIWRDWAEEERDFPRLDIDAALNTIERRSEKHKMIELEKGFRLNLERVPMRKMILPLRNFARMGFRRAEFQGANLFEANLSGTDLRLAKLQGALLSGANLESAHLLRAEMQGASLFRAKFEGAFLEGASMQGADLGSAQMKGLHLKDVNLQSADLYLTNLEQTKIEKAIFDEFTELLGAKLEGAALKSTDLSKPQYVYDHLEMVFGDASVKLP